jgi:hypothetical protein
MPEQMGRQTGPDQALTEDEPASELPWRVAAGDLGKTAVRRLTDLESGSVIVATVVLVVVVGIFHPGFLAGWTMRDDHRVMASC